MKPPHPKADRDVELSVEFNRAISRFFKRRGAEARYDSDGDLQVDASEIVVACASVMVAYLSAMPDMSQRVELLEKFNSTMRREVLHS